MTEIRYIETDAGCKAHTVLHNAACVCMAGRADVEIFTGFREAWIYMERKKKTGEMAVQDIALIGVMVAVIEVSKAALAFLPNIELTSFWMILFTLFFGWRILLVVPAFILMEGVIYGFGLWWVMYLYAWPLLALLAWLFRKQESVWFWSILSAAFGLMFGFLCAIPYVVIGAADGGGLIGGLTAGFSWWVAGIPWDITHGVGNFVLMLTLYRPVCAAMKRLSFFFRQY